MAIKINNTTVIDDGRNFSGVGLTITGGLYVNGTVGTAGSVLTSTGTGVQWETLPESGGSGNFDVGISSSVFVSVPSGIGTNTSENNNIFVGPGIAYSFPSTVGSKYVIESIQVTNTYSTELYLVGRHDYQGGSNVPILQRVIVPYQGSSELLLQPIVANPSDVLRLESMTGIGTTSLSVGGAIDAIITYSEKNDTNYIGVGKTIEDGYGTDIFTSVSNPSVIQSIRIINYDISRDIDVSVAIYRGGTVGQITTTGVRQGYLAYKLTIPTNSVVEICEKPKYLSAGDSIVGIANTFNNAISICASGKYIV